MAKGVEIMNVGELKKILESLPDDMPILIEADYGSMGSSQTGWMESMTMEEIKEINNLETRLVIVPKNEIRDET